MGEDEAQEGGMTYLESLHLSLLSRGLNEYFMNAIEEYDESVTADVDTYLISESKHRHQETLKGRFSAMSEFFEEHLEDTTDIEQEDVEAQSLSEYDSVRSPAVAAFMANQYQRPTPGFLQFEAEYDHWENPLYPEGVVENPAAKEVYDQLANRHGHSQLKAQFPTVIDYIDGVLEGRKEPVY